jgi:uncharacterized membrane protein
MKKLLSIAAISALLTTGMNANTITLNAEMQNTASVALGKAAVLGTAGTALFDAFEAGSVTLTLTDGQQTLLSEGVNLITNNEKTAVQMSLTAIPAMASLTTQTVDTIPVTCSYGIGELEATPITANTAFDLTTGAATDNANNVVGTLECEGTTTATQGAATDYQSIIAVSIIAG